MGDLTFLLRQLRSRTPELIMFLKALVEAESPSNEESATLRCAEVLSRIGTRLVGRPPEKISLHGHRHLVWRPTGRIATLLLGHFDTVWPLGTIAEMPFTVEGDRILGPGIFDMKAGVVQGLAAIEAVGAEQVALLFTSDEETGSHSSRSLIEELSRQAAAVLVLEPSADGALKTARKGVAEYDVVITGRAAHAGLEPEKGVNATVELANLVLTVAALGDLTQETTVTPTTVAAGTAGNVIPEKATLHVDVRAITTLELARVDRAIRDLKPNIKDASFLISGGVSRLPFDRSMSVRLFDVARTAAHELGLGRIAGVRVGSGSDASFSAAVGTPTLDGLGAVGGNAHARGEYVLASALSERAALVARMVEVLRR